MDTDHCSTRAGERIRRRRYAWRRPWAEGRRIRDIGRRPFPEGRAGGVGWDVHPGSVPRKRPVPSGPRRWREDVREEWWGGALRCSWW